MPPQRSNDDQPSTRGGQPSDSTMEEWLRAALEDSSLPVVSDPTAVLRVGEVLADRFSVHGLVRRGGMGAIYRGVDLRNSEPVAIKILGCIGAHVPERFLREARILAELDHPGVVRHIAHGTTPNEIMYLVMEWLQGEDLAERLTRQPLPVPETLDVMRSLCGALELIHSRGIVHRDLKPANVFLPEGGARGAKLLDFGVASAGLATRSLTQQGTLLGTVGYMSPEQARGDEDIDQRADLFALGCVLYECLTGRAPFVSAHALGVLAKVLHEQPARPSDVNPGLDPRLDGLVARLLAKDRDERLPSVQAVLDELASLARAPAAEAAPRPQRPSVGGAEQRIVSVIFGKAVGGGAVAQRGTHGVSDLSSRVCSRFGVQLASLKGGVLALLSSPLGEANDRASRAVSCALELHRLRPDLMVAVSTGLAETSLEVPIGAAIDGAAALLEQLDQSGVFVDPVTLGLIGLRFDVARVGSLHRVLAARRDFAASHVLMGRSTPHVGRQRELRTLDGVLDECVEESVSRLVLVTGPPGIGKSRLVSEWFVRSGRGGAVKALFARAEPSSSGTALALVERSIRDAFGIRESDDSETQYQSIVRHLERSTPTPAAAFVLEFVAELLGVPGPAEPSPVLRAARASPDVMRLQMRRALQAWLDLETTRQPVVVVLEDLHWADPLSVDFWAETARESPNRSLMIVALARPEAEKQLAALGHGAAVHLRLLGLAPRAAKQLVEFALERPLEPDVLWRVIQTADGNPFILEELIRRVATGSTDWPDTVMAMVQSRFENLPSEARRALRAASVFGERCWDAAVDEVIGTAANTRALLKLLAENELLVAASESRYPQAREYRFRHALLRDAAYAMLTVEDRRVAHALAGDWLERNQEKDAAALADHFQRASLMERALPWLVRAAKMAIDAGDTKTTIELADRGVELGASGAERGSLLLLRSYAQALAGTFDVPITREAVDLLPIGSAPWWLGLAVLIFGASVCGTPGEAAPYVKIAATAPFTVDRDVPFGQALQTLIGGLVLLGRSDVAEAVLDRAAEAVAAHPEPDPIFEAFLASARCALAAVTPIRGRWRLELAFTDGRRCAAALGAVGAVHGQMVALHYLAIAATHLGLYEEAVRACRTAIELAEPRIEGLRDAWPWLLLAKAYLRLGELDEARDTLAILEGWNDWNVQQMIPVLTGEALLRQGKLDDAVRTVHPACSGVSPRLCRMAACVLARAQLLLGTPGPALETVERALQLPASSRGLESDIELATLHAEALHASGQSGTAREAATAGESLVNGIASDIEDPQLRRSFLERVEPCARVRALGRTWTT
jgi:tetratricopeptide (TPR) repeat protein